MLPAIGAASLALDAVQSLTSPASSSPQPTNAFGPALSDVTEGLPASSPVPSTLSGFASTKISSDNISTLLNARGLTPPGLGGAFGAGDSISDSSPPSVSASSAASSVYNATNQLTQSTALPLGLNPFSVSV